VMRLKVSACLLLLAAGCAGPDPQVGHRPENRDANAVPGAVPSPQVPETPITIEEAISRALSESARLDPYRAGLHIAREEKGAARDLEDPQIRLAYGESTRTEDRGFETDQERRRRYRGVLRIYPPNPWVRNAVSHGGDARIQLATANLRAAEHEIAVHVHWLFHEILQRRRERTLLEDIAKVRNDQFSQTEEILSRGAGTASDVLMARIDALDARMDTEEALRDEHRAMTDLATYLGFEQGNEIKLAFPPIPLPGELDLAMLTTRAFEQRPDLAAVEWRAETARWDLTAARRISVPWFAHLQGAYTEERNGVDEDGWSVQAAIDLPVFSVSGSDIGIATAELEQFQAYADQARAQVRLEVRQSLARLRLARAELERYRQETSPVLDQLNADLASEVSTTLSPDDRADLREGILKAERLRMASDLAYERAWLELQIATASDWLIRPPGPE